VITNKVLRTICKTDERKARLCPLSPRYG